MLQVEKKYSEQQTTLFCLVLPSQSYKALLYHSKSAVVGRTKSYFIPFVDAEPGSWQESVGAHLALPLRSLVLKEQGTPTHTATGAVSKPCCRGEQAPQNLLNPPKREHDQLRQGRVIKFTCWTVHAMEEANGRRRWLWMLSEWNAMSRAHSLLRLHAKSSNDSIMYAMPILCSQGNGNADRFCHCTQYSFSFLLISYKYILEKQNTIPTQTNY